MRAAEPLSYAGAVASSPQVISSFNIPSQVYNMDGTEVPLDPLSLKVVTVRGVKHPIEITTGNKAQITCVLACSVSSDVLLPMIIFYKLTLKPELSYGKVPGTMYSLSRNGWKDSEL